MSEEQISLRPLNDVTVLITAPKVLDNSNAHQMLNAITGAQAEGRKFLIIDMSHLEFISSAGVGSILGTVESSREIGGDIVLCNVSPNVLHVMQVLDLTEYLTIKISTQEAALACGVGPK